MLKCILSLMSRNFPRGSCITIEVLIFQSQGNEWRVGRGGGGGYMISEKIVLILSNHAAMSLPYLLLIFWNHISSVLRLVEILLIFGPVFWNWPFFSSSWSNWMKKYSIKITWYETDITTPRYAWRVAINITPLSLAST